MGSKNKLKRFRENENFSHVFQPSRADLVDQQYPYKGHWNAKFFKKDQPIVLELGCGKGEYTVGMAQRFPEKNFIGIDIKGARFWKGAKIVEEQRLTNVAFVRTQIELLENLFEKAEVAEIWITFPDPQIKYKRTKHRMTNPDFLSRYRAILKADGVVHLKTDSEFMHGYTLGLLQGAGHEILYANHDIYRQEGSPALATAIQTFYENQYLEQKKPITFLSFKIN